MAVPAGARAKGMPGLRRAARGSRHTKGKSLRTTARIRKPKG